MASTHFLFASASLILLSFLLFSFPKPSASSTAPTPSASSTDFIDSVCYLTPREYTEFCRKTLSGDARARAAPDTYTMRKVACDLGEKFAKQAQKFILAEKKNATLSRTVKEALSVCARAYNEVISRFHDAPDEEDDILGAGDVDDIKDITKKCTESLDKAKDDSPKVKEIYDRVNTTLMYAQTALATLLY